MEERIADMKFLVIPETKDLVLSLPINLILLYHKDEKVMREVRKMINDSEGKNKG